MATLHLAPTDSAGGAIKAALAIAGRDEAALAFPDDLSCGPIRSYDWRERADWWAPFYDRAEVEEAIRPFWERVGRGDEQIVIWFGRQSACELAFFHACCDRLGDRSFSIVDVTGVPFVAARNGQPQTWYGGRVSAIGPHDLASLFEAAQPIADSTRLAAAERWRQLQAENSPFRIATPGGLFSAPAEYFDLMLLEQIGLELTKFTAVIGATMAVGDYWQVGNLMLQLRLVALAEQGKIVIDGDPMDIRAATVRLAG
jgi:hypothetical protein